MKEQVSEMIRLLKAIKIAPYKIEKDLGFSNGFLSKGSISFDKLMLLCDYFQKYAVGVEGEEHSYQIYGIVNPENGSIFYVGATRQELKKRLACHISESMTLQSWTPPSKKQAIICAIKKNGREPEIKLLETVSDKSLVVLYRVAAERESHWILKLNPIGNDKKKIPKEYKQEPPIKKPSAKPVIVQDLNKLTAVKPITDPPPQSNYSINTKKPYMNDAIKKKLGLKD